MPRKRHACRLQVALNLADAASTPAMNADEFDRMLLYVTDNLTAAVVQVEASPDDGNTWVPYRRFTTGTIDGVAAGLIGQCFVVDPVPRMFRFTNLSGGGNAILGLHIELIRQP